MEKAAYCFFSFGPDESCLHAAIRSIRQVDRSAFIAVFDDREQPVNRKPDVDLDRHTGFNREGNLRCRECALAMLAAYEYVAMASGAGWVAKVDCDTLVRGTRWKASDAELVGRLVRGRLFIGPLYALRPHVIPVIAHEVIISAKLDPQEDQIISDAAAHANIDREDRGLGHLMAFDYREPRQMECYENTDAITFGNRHEISERNPRETAARAMSSYLRASRGGHAMDFACQTVDGPAGRAS